TYQDGTARIPLVVPGDADAAHCSPAGSAPGPSPVARAPQARERAPHWLRSRRLAPQTATSPASGATAHRAHPLVFAALRLHLRSQRSLTLPVRRLTHLTAHWPSWWLNQAVPLAARPLPPLLCLFDTMPSSSSCFRTSLLVYHLLPVISKYLAKLGVNCRECGNTNDVALQVHECSTAVAGVDRGIRLNGVGDGRTVLSFRNVAPHRTDNAIGHSLCDPQGITNCQHLLAYL